MRVIVPLMGASTGGKRPGRPRIRGEVKAVIRELRAQGMTLSEVGRRVGISESSVLRTLAQMGAPLMRAPNGQRTSCVIDGCDRPRQSKAGYCNGHARRLKNGGKMVAEFESRMKQPEKCTFPDCTRRPVAKGYCPAHLRQQRVHGRMIAVRERTVWDACTYSAVHHRCRQIWGRVQQYPCLDCSKPAEEWAYDGKDPTELYVERTDWGKRKSIVPYSRFPEFYMPMCKACHKRRDMGELHEAYAEFRAWRKRNRNGSGSNDEPPPF